MVVPGSALKKKGGAANANRKSGFAQHPFFGEGKIFAEK
jgi:hypothetical protein